MENGQQIQPNEQILPEEPKISEQELTIEEINKEAKYWWAEIDKQVKFDDYKNAFDKYNYYRDLKQNYINEKLKITGFIRCNS